MSGRYVVSLSFSSSKRDHGKGRPAEIRNLPRHGETLGGIAAAAEYSSQAATSACDTNTCYVVLDHLGSTRMLTDANGSSTVTQYDYLPFAQELLASTNGRTTGMGYPASADGSNPKFTGKNRDQETFLDWYEVRYMSGAQGRFQSVDPANAGANPADPQTWNAYAYVGNNPLSYTDPSGLGFWSDVGNFFANLGSDIFGSGGGTEYSGHARWMRRPARELWDPG
jgi:RHS repeat-associated protein